MFLIHHAFAAIQKTTIIYSTRHETVIIIIEMTKVLHGKERECVEL